MNTPKEAESNLMNAHHYNGFQSCCDCRAALGLAEGGRPYANWRIKKAEANPPPQPEIYASYNALEIKPQSKLNHAGVVDSLIYNTERGRTVDILHKNSVAS